MREIYSIIIFEKTAIINDLIELYKESNNSKAIAKARHKIQSDICSLLAKRDKLLDLALDNRLSNEEFEQRNCTFNKQIEELTAKLTKLNEEEQKNLTLNESIEILKTSIENELDFTEDLSKSVIDSFIDKIVVYKGKTKNQIDLKIFLKLLPTSPQNFTENSHVLTFGSGHIIQARGGNSRVLKAYDLTFNYELCYHLE